MKLKYIKIYLPWFICFFDYYPVYIAKSQNSLDLQCQKNLKAQLVMAEYLEYFTIGVTPGTWTFD